MKKKITLFCLAIVFLVIFGALVYYFEPLPQIHSYKLEKSCQKNNIDACNELYLSDKTQQAFYLVKPILENACKGAKTNACNILSDIFIAKGLVKNSIQYLETGCEKDNMDSCVKLGAIFLKEKNFKKAMEAFDKPCKNNDSFACGALKTSRVLDCDPNNDDCEKTYKTLIKECDEKEALSCALLARYYIAPNNSIPEKGYTLLYPTATSDFVRAKAIEAYSKACEYEEEPLFPLLEMAAGEKDTAWKKDSKSICDLVAKYEQEIAEDKASEEKRRIQLAEKRKMKDKQKAARKEGLSSSCAEIYRRICLPCFGPTSNPSDTPLDMMQVLELELFYYQNNCVEYYDFPSNYSIKNYSPSCYGYKGKKSKYNICNGNYD